MDPNFPLPLAYRFSLDVSRLCYSLILKFPPRLMFQMLVALFWEDVEYLCGGILLAEVEVGH